MKNLGFFLSFHLGIINDNHPGKVGKSRFGSGEEKKIRFGNLYINGFGNRFGKAKKSSFGSDIPESSVSVPRLSTAISVHPIVPDEE
jgi:hypothetical protein